MTVRIGTRGSLLAIAQSRQVMRSLKQFFPSEKFELVVIKTLGDEFKGVELFKKNNVGVFTKKLEEKLLDGKIDIAVHSLKDMPIDLPKGLALAAFPKREDTRDVLITRGHRKLSQLPYGASVGTGSSRRKSQLLLARPDLLLCDLRGNLDTRVGRVIKEKKLDAVVLAHAGLKRVKKFSRYAVPLAPEVMMPAVGQGALGIETRAKENKIIRMLKRLNDAPTEKCVRAERAFLKKLKGGCRVPVGIVSELRHGKILLRAKVFSVKGPRAIEGVVIASANAPEAGGERLAKLLLRKGAGKLLLEARGKRS